MGLLATVRSVVAAVRDYRRNIEAIAEMEHARAAWCSERAELLGLARRLVLAERWARCAALHDAGTTWRPLLSAGAMHVLVAELGQVRVELERGAEAISEFDVHPTNGGQIPTVCQQLAIVQKAMLDELFSVEIEQNWGAWLRSRGGAQAGQQPEWDQQKLDQATGELLHSARVAAATRARLNLGLSDTQEPVVLCSASE